ncbi:MAG TPA: hypothetical protein VGN26_17345 [Armatimonadota bacterium]
MQERSRMWVVGLLAIIIIAVGSIVWVQKQRSAPVAPAAPDIKIQPPPGVRGPG